jgi:hypothetical protein
MRTKKSIGLSIAALGLIVGVVLWICVMKAKSNRVVQWDFSQIPEGQRPTWLPEQYGNQSEHQGSIPFEIQLSKQIQLMGVARLILIDQDGRSIRSIKINLAPSTTETVYAVTCELITKLDLHIKGSKEIARSQLDAWFQQSGAVDHTNRFTAVRRAYPEISLEIFGSFEPGTQHSITLAVYW